jgi:hypothetical protein
MKYVNSRPFFETLSLILFYLMEEGLLPNGLSKEMLWLSLIKEHIKIRYFS